MAIKSEGFDIDLSPIAIWWLMVEIVGLIAFPFLASLCQDLNDKGYSVSKIFGMLLTTYLTWIVSALGLFPFNFYTILILLLIVGAIGLYLTLSGPIKPRISWEWEMMVKNELVFTFAFLSFSFILSIRPDIYFTHSEDFMNFAMLQSILRSDYFPPMDPWFAGMSLNYYYLGHLSVAFLTKLTGISSSITYNLSIAMFFALAANAAYGIGYNFTGKTLYGLITILFTLISGFAIGFVKLIKSLFEVNFNLIDWFTGYKFWEDTSIIPGSTTFYPYYTFIHGYLQAHMISISFQLMFILLLYNFLKKSKRERGDFLFIGLCLGFFSALNLWEYPTYLILSFAAIIIFSPKQEWGRTMIGIALLSFILFLPYYLARSAGGFYGLGIVLNRTPFLNFTAVFGALLFIILPFLILKFLDNNKTLVVQVKSKKIQMALIIIVLMILTILLNFQILILIALIVLLCFTAIFMGNDDREMIYIYLLILMGAVLSLFCETIYINDAFSYPYERFNTVMKVYLQIWVFWGVSAALTIYQASTKLVKPRIWGIFTTLIILISLIHPLAMTASWSSGNFGFWESNVKQTLDGALYLEEIAREDYKAISWINQNIKNQPILLEAPGVSYTYSSRISTFTGLPTIIGWGSHEIMWGRNHVEISQRILDVDTIYSTTDLEVAINLLNKYGVDYIYIGWVGKMKYTKEGINKFRERPKLFLKVYESEGVEIYRFMNRFMSDSIARFESNQDSIRY
ncbi:MAG: DUF2298 domain-containing protein [Methanocellales archaeon]